MPYSWKALRRQPSSLLTGSAGAPLMVALVSVPVFVLAAILWGAYLRHEQQYADARDVIETYRAGLAVLPDLDRMRALGRAAFAVNPQPERRALYGESVARAQHHMDIFLARVGQRAEIVPTLEAPLGRMEQMPWLEEIVVDVEADTQGPLPVITRYADNIHRLLASVLYGADLPERGGAQSTEMLLVVPDTLRRLRHELSLLQMLALPSDFAPGTRYSDDLREIDRTWNAVIELGDMLEAQLLDIEQRQGLLPEGRNPSRIDDVRAYIDLVESHYILGSDGLPWNEAWQAGLRAGQAIADIEAGLVDTAERRLTLAHDEQRRADLLTAAGLLALYIAIVYFVVQYYRSRAAALRERELQREVESRRAREHELMHLNQLGEALMGCQSPTDACDVFARSAIALFPGARGALLLASQELDRLLLASQWGGDAPVAAGFAPVDCRAVREQRPCRCTGGDGACAHYAVAPSRPHDCIPLQVDGQLLGLCWLEHAGDADDARLQLALSATESLKLAITNIRLRETLHEQAIRDTLTGLYNRRHLQEVFRREIAHACRSAQPIALVVLDIDHFKQVNDRYGHEAGDQALVALARHLRDGLRASDFSFRLGGEEFVLLLRTDLLGARRATENLLATFREKRFRFHEAAPVQITFSAGVVEAPLYGQDFDTLFRLADEALYRAKEAGRNRVELAQPDVPQAETVRD